MAVRERARKKEDRKRKEKKVRKRWYYDFMIRGRRYRGAIPEARTQEEAEKAETLIRLSVYEGTYGKSTGAEFFSKAVEEVFLPYSRLNKRSHEHDAFRARTLVEHFRGKALRDITPRTIEQYKEARLKTKSNRGNFYSPATVNRELAVLSKIFSLAADNGLVAENPCLKVKKLEVDNERERYLTADEEERLFARLTGRRAHLRPIVTVALHTGIRRGALLALRWAQVDFARGTITVLKRHSKNKREYTVPMNEAARAELLALRESAGDCPWVFVNPHTGVSLTEIKRAFVGALADAKISDFRFHDLRHTFATRLADKGVPLSVVRDLLGQKSLKMARRYTHSVVETKAAAVQLLCAQGGADCLNFVSTNGRRPQEAAAA